MRRSHAGNFKGDWIFYRISGTSHDCIYDGHERFLLYHAVLDRMGNQLCQGFYQGFLKDERRMRLDHLRDLTDCHICDVRLTKRSKLSWEKD